MSVIDERIKECEDICNELRDEGRDGYRSIGIGGPLSNENGMQFVEELGNFLNRWNWRIFNCTGRI